MPKRFSKEFRDDVVWVTRGGRLTYEGIAHDFNISSSSLQRWLRQADIDNGVCEGLASTEQEEVVGLRRDSRRLRRESEILRRAGGEAVGAGGGGVRGHGRDRPTVRPAGQSPSVRDAVGRGGTAMIMGKAMAAVAPAADVRRRNRRADQR